ncbi:flagellar assembly protein FliW [Selenomonas caprae]|jgi:flagellar assembly factor FliW|uniref:Flagellar assembly factor FliW n=2 Tax=Selenomonas TaxID=970 RepID=A0A1I6Z2V5_SELRU|nr:MULTISPECIES: flagellar assembly protein FliW [Selenomonas]TYZ29004.1 flagellar assembly protein FliW [Selenomonas caprae]SFH75517.1 flagellar assembly factor FliW [Selenomonas ruminantium]SFT57037.1 flagellar assembly factor FliW [Selenomonas ruminantium]
MKKVNTLRFGEIEVEEEKVVHFEDGIPAFEDEHEFLIIPYDDESPYVFLQSITTPDLAFLMTMPFVFFPEYEFELDDDSQNKLGIKTQEDMLIYTLLTIPGGKVADMTANLMAPVVLNQNTMQARQIVLDKSRYTTKHRLFPEHKEENK